MKVVDRAMLTCKNSGFEISDDFVDASKIVQAGAASKKINNKKHTFRVPKSVENIKTQI